MFITSRNNDLVKKVKSLKEKKFRDEYNQYIIEGERFVGEAIKEKANIDYIFVEEGYNWNNIEVDSNKVIQVSKSVMEAMSCVKNSQGILALVYKEPQTSIDSIDLNDERFFLILDNVQDPGNVGTIIRTADSIGLKYIFVRDTSCDIYNPKVLRSTMGSIFRVKCLMFNDIYKLVDSLKSNGIKVYATSLDTDTSIYNCDFEKSAVVVGNEANGVDEEFFKVADKIIKIPMRGNAESLNVAVASSIIMYEAYRQSIKGDN